MRDIRAVSLDEIETGDPEVLRQYVIDARTRLKAIGAISTGSGDPHLRLEAVAEISDGAARATAAGGSALVSTA